ncbi:unnamed protein product [Ixodes pacificus]
MAQVPPLGVMNAMVARRATPAAESTARLRSGYGRGCGCGHPSTATPCGGRASGVEPAAARSDSGGASAGGEHLPDGPDADPAAAIPVSGHRGGDAAEPGPTVVATAL